MRRVDRVDSSAQLSVSPVIARLLPIFTVVVVIALGTAPLRGDIVISEVMAGASDRLLQWSSSNLPRLGTGPAWFESSYQEPGWETGQGPIGYGSFSPQVSAINTNVATRMQYLTPSLYLRKTFTVSEADAALAEALQLAIEYNDGFICYLNGVEVARRWAGPPIQFHYHDQPAYSPNLSSTSNPGNLYVETITFGAANTRLIAGENLLAIHGLNFSRTSSNFVIKADLRIAAAPAVPLVNHNDQWRFFPGVVEPSGVLFDPTQLASGKLSVPWGAPNFDDTNWGSGAGPVGAGNVSNAGTIVQGVIGQTPSLYVRSVFTPTAEQRAQTQPMQLLVDYDDAFVAYVNGTEVARAGFGTLNEPNTFTPHTAVAGGVRNRGSQVTYTIDPPARLLREGANVLAIQVHNVSISEADVYVRADLRTGNGEVIVPSNSTWRYFVGSDEPVPSSDESVDESPEGAQAGVDWIELQNTGPVAVSLKDWRLTDDPSEPAKWVFPDVSIPAGGFLVVICDDESGANAPGSFLHANFKLDRNGEYLALFDQSGVLVQQFESVPKASPFHSYGRDSAGEYAYFDTPTPGASNGGTELAGVVATPGFSVAPGFYTSARSVALTTTTAGATIRYTTDGSEPTATSGTVYSGAITVGVSTAIRARAFKAGLVPSTTASSTYLILNSTDTKRSLPAVCITADQTRALFRPFGIFAIFNNASENYSGGIWHANGNRTHYNNPNLRGLFAERPANLQISYPNGTPGVNIDAGIRAAGSPYSRPRYVLAGQNRTTANTQSPWPSNPTEKPQINIFFRDDYGVDPLTAPLFPGIPRTQFHDLRLRAGKNDISNPFVKDELMRRLFGDTGQVTVHGINTTLWVNGVYRGYYNLTERPREDFFQNWFDSEREWDVWVIKEVASGDSLMLQELITYMRTNPQNILARYQGSQSRLDVTNFVDYLLVNLYGVTGDWPHNNHVIGRERSVDGKWIYAMWDAEGAFGGFSGNARTNMFVTGTTGSIVTSNPQGEALNLNIRTLYTLLRVSPEFKLLFADRIQKHFFNGGALTDENVLSRKNALRDEMRPLIPGFDDNLFNRWINGQGDTRRYTTSGATNAPSRRGVLLDGYVDDTQGGVNVPAHFVAEGLWPATKPPAFAQHGGSVPGNHLLTITNPNASGTIYYSTNGIDPRAPGGAVQGAPYEGSVRITQTTLLKARVLRGSEWSALTEATFSPPQGAPLVITEIMFNPAAPAGVNGDDFEFLELKNVGTGSVNLNGMHFTSGIEFAFPNGATLAPGAFLVLARDPAQFAQRYPGVAVFGGYGSDSSLSNGGETITLADVAGTTIFSVTYDDTAPWPAAADGGGQSLVPLLFDANPAPNNASNWRASVAVNGSPGRDDSRVPIVPVFINELRANPVAGQRDSIEIFNPHAQAVDISEWWLSDSSAEPQKFRIPAGTVVAANGYHVFSESDFNAVPGQGNSFELSRTGGEDIVLSSGNAGGGLTGYQHSFTSFAASSPGVSLGRYFDSTNLERFVAQSAATFGGPNAAPAVGPVVITEIMHTAGAGFDDFLELRNISNAPVRLFNPEAPMNSWRIRGLGFTFPAGVTLQPGQIALLSPLSASAFRTKYAVPDSVAVFQYTGTDLASVGSIAIESPAEPIAGQPLSYITSDAVAYHSAAPWPDAPRLTGASLERINWRSFGDDVANWRASAVPGGSLGRLGASTFAEWQNLHFSAAQLADPQVSGADGDPDSDGIINRWERLHGLDPLFAEPIDPIATSLANDGEAGPFLTLQYRRSLSIPATQFAVDTADEVGNWTLGAAVPVGTPVNHGDNTETVTMRDTVPAPGAERRFIRLRVAGE